MHLDRDIAFQMEKTHRCRICKDSSTLVTRWDGKANSHDLVCGKCKGDAFEKRPSMMERLAAGESLPIEVINKLQAKYGGLPMSTQALAVINEPQMLQRIERTRWSKDLTVPQRQMLAEVSVSVGLDPLLKELIIYEGEIYITLPGYEGLARRSADFEGLRAVPMNQEQKKEYGITAPHAWVAEVWKRGMRVPSIGVGTADPANPLRNNPFEKREPWRMARSRAIRQAVRPYFGTEASPVKLRDADEVGVFIDHKTGEIIDTKPRSAKPEIHIVQPEASNVIEGEIVDEIPFGPDDGPEEPQQAGDYQPAEVPVDAETSKLIESIQTGVGIVGWDAETFREVLVTKYGKERLEDLSLDQLRRCDKAVKSGVDKKSEKKTNGPAETTVTGKPLPKGF